MKTRLFLFVAGLSILFAGSVLANGVAGKWTAQVPGRGGETRETTFSFQVEGEKLTGTMSGMQREIEISDGKVQGDQISFKVVLSFQGNEVTLLYEGELSGDEIKFTRWREGSDQSQQFTAKRAQ